MKRSIVAVIVALVIMMTGCARRVEIDNNNRGPVVITMAQAVYPAEAAAKNVEGKVWVKMWVNDRGKVTKAMIEKTPDQSLCDAAMDAAMRTTFKPAMMEGKAIGVWLIYPFAVTAAYK